MDMIQQECDMIEEMISKDTKPKISTESPDFRVCEQAMKNPEVFAKLARWGT